MVKNLDGTERVVDKAYWREKNKKRWEQDWKEIKEDTTGLILLLLIPFGIVIGGLIGYFDPFCDSECQRRQNIRERSVDRYYDYQERSLERDGY